MQFKRQVKAEESINLTPLIDVVFLLLIFFMVSTTFTKETHLQIDLPEASGELQPVAADQIEVVIDAKGSFTVNGKPLVNSQVSTLRAAIEELGHGNTSIPFLITGDANARYEAIVMVMDLAGQMGYSNLSMTTRAPAESNGEGSSD